MLARRATNCKYYFYFVSGGTIIVPIIGTQAPYRYYNSTIGILLGGILYKIRIFTCSISWHILKNFLELELKLTLRCPTGPGHCSELTGNLRFSVEKMKIVAEIYCQ